MSAQTGTAESRPREQSGAQTAEAVADFLRRMRVGIEDGLDPVTAARRSAAELPKTSTGKIQKFKLREMAKAV